MAVNVRGKNLAVTSALQEYAEKRVALITKQFKLVGDISVLMRVEKGQHIVEITVPAKGIVFRSQESTREMYQSIDLAVEKITRQIHKYKTRLVKRKYNNFVEAEEPAVEAESAEEFKVVRNKKYVMRPMGVQEAIMQMNLLNHDFFLFYNVETNLVSVVYKRNEGDYGLIESEMK